VQKTSNPKPCDMMQVPVSSLRHPTCKSIIRNCKW